MSSVSTKDMCFVATEDMSSVSTKEMSFVETEDMSSVAAKDMSFVETEDMSSVAKEDAKGGQSQVQNRSQHLQQPGSSDSAPPTTAISSDFVWQCWQCGSVTA